MRKLLLFTIICCSTFNGSSQLFLSIGKSYLHESFTFYRRYQHNRDNELYHKVYGIELGYRKKIFIANFQSSFLYFNRDIHHKKDIHIGGGSTQYYGAYTDYYANVNYMYLNHRIATGINWANIKKEKNVSFMLSLLGFYQLDTKIFSKESNHEKHVTTNENVSLIMGQPEYVITDFPVDYSPFEMCTYSPFIHQIGFELNSKVIIKRYYLEAFSAFSRTFQHRVFYNDRGVHSNEPELYSFWSMNVGFKLGAFLGKI